MHRLEEMETMVQMELTEIMERRVVQEVAMGIILAVLDRNLLRVAMVVQVALVQLGFQEEHPIAALQLPILAQMVQEETVVEVVQVVKEVDFQEEAVRLMVLLEVAMPL